MKKIHSVEYRKLLQPVIISLAFILITVAKILWLINSGSPPSEVTNFKASCIDNGTVIEVAPADVTLKSEVISGEIVQEGISPQGSAIMFKNSHQKDGKPFFYAPVPQGYGGRIRLLLEGESIAVSGKCKSSI